MNVAAILKAKGGDVETVRVSTPLLDVVRLLAGKRIGAVVVTEPGDGRASHRVVGIVSERDVVRALAEHGAAAGDMTVSEIMSRMVVTCVRADTLDRLMSQMTVRRFRHLPVVEDGELVGIVSIGDVVKHHIAAVEMEASALRDYIAS